MRKYKCDIVLACCLDDVSPRVVAELARQYDLTVSEVEGWIDEDQRSMENGFKARPKDIREQYESELRETKEALGEAHLQIYALKKFNRLLDADEFVFRLLDQRINRFFCILVGTALPACRQRKR
ncbi:hypothetical protein F0A16_03230 [Salinicola corii]|uniref:Transposase n=1 Tax=Salinicola corii TaxID=2606937 RepID=A0A640WJL0_9GAMM|nr:hypothetical protein [Salinicola corii]KAA0020808.1 hypothetical protein F0A16_03230 [Salinicola corii]